MKIERNGNCWENAFKCLIRPPLENLPEYEIELVHGLPTGCMGDAAEMGVYCHAWVEYPELRVVYDTEATMMVPRDVYYKVGKIGYCKRYTRLEALAMIDEHKSFGPWDEKIIARDDEVDDIIEAQG